MIFWQYNASREPVRLAVRLAKYKGGQILLNTSGKTVRGLITDYVEKGPEIIFHLGWLAEKRIISPSVWFKKDAWKWELIHMPLHPKISCAINLEILDGEERGSTEGTGTESLNRKVELRKFYQNKEWKIWRFHTLPKCLFFSTRVTGERGVLFQPQDPRNLLLKDYEVIDPFAPKRPNKPPS
ncbi:MAG: hypothetical protein EXS46_03880 [Candidatus Taylorbacteria bacterium]|nr:hypothetical protein [Candidatus Taylorbacteria bacterium]